MNILDENIPIEVQRLLRDWHISTSRIGYDLAQKGIQDEDIIPLLHRVGHATLFTLDPDFYRRHWCHANYCLVWLDVPEPEAALYIRRVLRHPQLNTIAKRLGTIIRVTSSGLTVWRLHAETEINFTWGR